MSIGIDLSNRSVAIGLNNKADANLQNAQLENIIDNKTIVINEEGKFTSNSSPDNITIEKNSDGNLQVININSKKIIPAYKEYSFTKTNESGLFTSDNISGFSVITNGTSCLLCTNEDRFYYSTSGLENLSENSNYKTIDTTIITSEMVKEANPDADLTNFETEYYIKLLACNVVDNTYYVFGYFASDSYYYLFLLEIDSANDFSINKTEIIGFVNNSDYFDSTINIENNNIKILCIHDDGMNIYEKVDNVWTLTNTYKPSSL